MLPPVVAVLVVLVPLLWGAGEVPQTLEDFTSRVERRVPEQLDRDGVPGAAVAVVVEGEVVWAEGFGVGDRESGDPVTSDTVFQAGSNSKSLTAWAVLRLAEQDRIDLDGPVQEQIEGWKLPDGERRPEEVTAAGLLSHTAGMGFAVGGMPRSTEELREWEVDAELFEVEHEPGEGFVYSNPGYAVLGLLIEEAAERPLAEVMTDEILEPLGMRDSAFALDDRLAARAATGYDHDDQPVPVDWQGPVGASGLHTTAVDLARFVAAVHDRGAGAPAGDGVLQPGSVDRLHQPRVTTAGIPHALMAEQAGFGHFVETLPSGHRAVAHGGEEEGWVSGYVAVPDTGDGLVALTNSRAGYPLLIEQLADWAQWRSYGSLRLTRAYERLTVGARAAIGLFATLGAVLAVTIADDARAGARPRPPWQPGHRRRGFGLIACGAAVLVAWWGLAADVLAGFVPHLTPWLTLTITASAVLLLVRALLQPVQR